MFLPDDNLPVGSVEHVLLGHDLGAELVDRPAHVVGCQRVPDGDRRVPRGATDLKKSKNRRDSILRKKI